MSINSGSSAPPLSFADAVGAKADASSSTSTSPPQRFELPPVKWNADGNRVDVRVPYLAGTSSQYWTLQNPANGQKFCYGHYFARSCSYGERCSFEHDMALSREHLAFLLSRTRQSPCHVGPGCRSQSCFYGHHCPEGRSCPQQDACKFELHLSPAQMAVSENA